MGGSGGQLGLRGAVAAALAAASVVALPAGTGASAGAQSPPSLPGLPALPGAPGAGAGANPPPGVPAGCDPTPLASVGPSAAQLCVNEVLVTQDTDAHEQNDSVFTVTDHHATLTATVPNWWPSGGPVAGMVITMWGKLVGGVFRVDRWIDRSHGTGPAPAGPYQLASALDVSSGRLPEHRMVWVPTFVFLLDPQQPPAGSDGDIHVQTANGCPAGGVTTESTPPLRGYVDHPALPGETSSSDITDAPANHLADAPPVGIPVMILGATRYDYGFGWWELHPIRAWRFLTATEAQRLAADCAANPVPQLDHQAPVPVPFGVPPCTDGSEFGSPPGIGACHTQCYVARTVIGQREQLAGPCAGIEPVVTPDQETLSQVGASSTPASPPAGAPAGGGAGGGSRVAALQRAARRQTLAALARSYGPACRALRRRGGRPFHGCLLAMARLGGAETRSAAFACRHEPHRRRRGRSDYALCVRAGHALLRKLAPHRIVEG